MRSPVTLIRQQNVYNDQEVMINPPIVFNGIPVKRSWKEAGSKYLPKNTNIILYGKFKLIQCPNAYVLLCISDGCKNIASSADLKCKNHNNGKEVYTFCRNDNCTKQASFGYEDKKPLFCKDHKETDMYDVKNMKCKYPNCTISPAFGYEEQKPEYCKNHKDKEMVNVVSKRCKYSKCTKQPTFGLEGQPAQYCKNHKSEEMIDVMNKRCETPGCIIRPTFGYVRQKARYCKNHKLDNMLDVAGKQCEESGCTKHPIFGYKGQTVKYCKDHKQEEMVDVRNKLCEYTGCITRPTFGYEGQKAQCCKDHILDGMINVVSKECEFRECKLYPSFGYEGQSALFCKKHKLEGMIDNHKQCVSLECTIQPSYRKLYSKILISCKEHSSLNEYSVIKSTPICQVINCQNTAYFINPVDSNVYPIRCSNHHHSTDIELLLKICPNCEEKLYFPSNKKICMNCGYYRERKLYKFKETPCPA